MKDTTAPGPVVVPKTRAIIFDLVNSAACHRAAFEEIFLPFGIHDFEYSQFAGWRTRDVVEKVLRDAGCNASPHMVETASARKRQLAREKMAACDPVVLPSIS